MRVSAVLLDFIHAVRAGVFTDRVSDVSGAQGVIATYRETQPGRGAWFYASASKTKEREETAFAKAIRGADGLETSCDYMRRKRTDVC